MESVGNLIQLLRSQLALYQQIRDLLAREKRTIIEWKFTDTSSLVKDKEVLLRKESILEEARKTLVARIATEYNIESPTLLSIIAACPDDDKKQELSSLRESLTLTAQEIKNENISLRLLYSTNIRLVNDLHAKIGFMPIGKYGMESNKNFVSAPATFTAAG